MSEHFVDVMGSVKVTVNDPDVIARCVDNLDDEGNPQPDEQGSDGWRNTFYDLSTEAQVLEHLAFNAAVNGARDLSGLDGWADLPPEAATMEWERWVEVERIVEATP